MRATFLITVAILLFTAVSVVLADDSDNISVYSFEFEGQSGIVDLELNSQTMGFDLHDLQPGDSRITTTQDGTSVRISRLDEDYKLDVGGEIFEIPAIDGPDHPVPEHAVRHIVHFADDVGSGLTILSQDPLDESQRATIRDALLAAGITDDIRFLSPGLSMHAGDIEQEIEIDGDDERRMIIKQVVRD